MRFSTIYLASRSPRRVELLAQIGMACEIVPADIDESQHAGEPPAHYVQRLAQEKALAGVAILGEKAQKIPVLAADTTVVLSGQVLGKPESDADAQAMLRALAGSTHEVLTAVALAFNGQLEVVLSQTQVQMMPLTALQIATYIATGEHRDKAGSYGIQGAAGAWVTHIDGSFSGVMGLPVYETAQLLRKFGIIAL